MTFELSNILLSLGTSSIVIVLKEKHSLVNYKATNYNNARMFSLLNNSFQSRMHCVKSVQIRSFFLVRIFPHSDWIRKDTLYLSVFGLNAGKTDQKKLRIWTLFTQWWSMFSEKGSKFSNFGNLRLIKAFEKKPFSSIAASS